MTKLKNNSHFYLICFGLYIFLEILISTEITYFVNSIYISLFKYSVFAIFFVFFIIENFSLIGKDKTQVSNLIMLGFLLLLSLIIFWFSHTLQLFVLFSFSFAFRNVNFKSVLKTSFIFSGLAFLFTLIMASINVYPNEVSFRGDNIRYSLGFLTSTLPESMVLFSFLTLFGLKGKKLNGLMILFYFLFGLLIFYLTRARTSFLLLILSLLLSLLVKFKFANSFVGFVRRHKLLLIIFSLVPVIFLLMSVFLTYLLSIGNGFAIYLNGILSTRLRLQLDAFQNYSFSLFGNIFETHLNDLYAGVDNSYLFIYFNYGFIALIFVLYTYYKLVKLSLIRKNSCLFSILVVILIQGLTDPYIIDFKYCPFILLSGMLLFQTKKGTISDYSAYLYGGRLRVKRVR